MSDDIKIRVGVSSTVKADMDKLVREIGIGASKIKSGGPTLEDLLSRGKTADTQKKNDEILSSLKDSLAVQKAEYRKTADELTKIYGRGGAESGEAFKRGFTGRNFRGALIGMMRGDLSALTEMIGPAAAKIGGIFTAAIAGWKLGQAIDKQFDISGKVAKAWTHILDIDAKYLNMQRRLYKEANEARWADEKKAREESEFAGKRAEIKGSFSQVGASPREEFDYENKKLNTMQDELRTLTDEAARREKILQIDEQWIRVKQAAAGLDQEQKRAIEETNRAIADRKKKQEDLAEAEKKASNERVAAATKEAEAIRDADKKAHENKLAAIDKEIARLELLIAKGKEAGAAAIGAVNDPAGWRAGKNAEKDKEREKARANRMLNEWAAQEARGVKLPQRAKDALANAEKANAGILADIAKAKLEQQAAALREAREIQQARDITEIRKTQEKLLTLK